MKCLNCKFWSSSDSQSGVCNIDDTWKHGEESFWIEDIGGDRPLFCTVKNFYCKLYEMRPIKLDDNEEEI